MIGYQLIKDDKWFHYKYLLILCCGFYICACLLWGCASSAVERDAAANVDMGMRKINAIASNDNANLADQYQNANQMTKGAVLGGVAGGVLGSAVSGGMAVLPSAAVGAVFGSTYGRYIDSYATLEDKVKNISGGKVIEIGDHILIVLPSSRIFSHMTPKIKPGAYAVLNSVTHYLNQYPNMLIQISVFTDKTGLPERDYILSQQQADSVVRFLTESGINSRVLSGVGRGGSHLLVRNGLSWYDSLNYRLEITMEKQPV